VLVAALSVSVLLSLVLSAVRVTVMADSLPRHLAAEMTLHLSGRSATF
jgi:hypothetical protein